MRRAAINLDRMPALYSATFEAFNLDLWTFLQ